MSFWYREHLAPLAPPAALVRAAEMRVAQVTRTDPPPIQPGMSTVMLDPRGRLLALVRMPAQVNDDKPRADAVRALFAAAEIDATALIATAPDQWPLVPCETRRAWTGTRPSTNDSVRIDLCEAGWTPTYFRVRGPWEPLPPHLAGPLDTSPSLKPSTPSTVAVYLRMILYWGAVLGSIWFARYNLRRNSGDARGARRLAIYLFTIYVAAWILGGSHTIDAYEETWLFILVAGQALYYAATYALVYIALEPFVRKRWPVALVSWSRLTAGRWKDALVGREVLIGTLCGCLSALALCIDRLLPGWLGAMPAVPRTSLVGMLGSVRHDLALTLLSQPQAFATGLIALWMIVALSRTMRSVKLGAGIYLLLAIFIDSLQGSQPLRLSVLTAIVSAGVFVRNLLLQSTITTDLSAWFATGTLVTLAVVLGLTAYGCVTTSRGRWRVAEVE